MAIVVILCLHLFYCNEDDGIVPVLFSVICFVAKKMMAIATIFFFNFVLL
jgi:hypothetical protein